MELLLSSVEKETIIIVGQKKSNAMLRHLYTMEQTSTLGLTLKMVHCSNYELIPLIHRGYHPNYPNMCLSYDLIRYRWEYWHRFGAYLASKKTYTHHYNSTPKSKHSDTFRRGPAQDVPFDLILWYIAKTITTF